MSYQIKKSVSWGFNSSQNNNKLADENICYNRFLVKKKREADYVYSQKKKLYDNGASSKSFPSKRLRRLSQESCVTM